MSDNIKFGQGRQILHSISEWVMQDKHRQAMLANRELSQLQRASIDRIDDTMTEFLRLTKQAKKTDTADVMENLRRITLGVHKAENVVQLWPMKTPAEQKVEEVVKDLRALTGNKRHDDRMDGKEQEATEEGGTS